MSAISHDASATAKLHRGRQGTRAGDRPYAVYTMTETVHLRARYRYASTDARDAALVAALGALDGSGLRCQITLGAIVTVDVDVPLFGASQFISQRRGSASCRC